MLSPAFVSEAEESRRLPAGFATLALLPSAGAPVRAAPYASPSVRRHTSLPTEIGAHISKAPAPRHYEQARAGPGPSSHRADVGRRRADANTPPTCDVRTFFTGIEGIDLDLTLSFFGKSAAKQHD